jgi:hypothetical protein
MMDQTATEAEYSAIETVVLVWKTLVWTVKYEKVFQWTCWKKTTNMGRIVETLLLEPEVWQ